MYHAVEPLPYSDHSLHRLVVFICWSVSELLSHDPGACAPPLLLILQLSAALGCCTNTAWVSYKYSIRLFSSSLFTEIAQETIMGYMYKPVPDKMRLEMVMWMQTKILDGFPRSHFERLIWKEIWTLTFEDFDLRFDKHFEFRLLRNGLYESWLWASQITLERKKERKKISQNWPWARPCWNCTTTYKFSVSVMKMGKAWTGEASDIVKAESSGQDPRATGGLVDEEHRPCVRWVEWRAIRLLEGLVVRSLYW